MPSLANPSRLLISNNTGTQTNLYFNPCSLIYVGETISRQHILGVGGMTCNGCANNVKNALSAVTGVSDVNIDLEGAKATINSDSEIDKQILEVAVTGAGYTIHEPGAAQDLFQLPSEPAQTEFNWRDGPVWKQAAHNTKWCLIGCSIGDFGTIFLFQITENPWAWSVMSIMLLAMFNGIMTSIALETFILMGQMPLKEAFRVAIGMSLISMISMEASMNAVDVLLTGGAKLTIWVMPIMLIAGFLTPWPYNYWRLKKYGQACH